MEIQEDGPDKDEERLTKEEIEHLVKGAEEFEELPHNPNDPGNMDDDSADEEAEEEDMLVPEVDPEAYE